MNTLHDLIKAQATDPAEGEPRYWRWTITGEQRGYHGTMNPGVDESGVMVGPGLAEALLWFIEQWDGIDQIDEAAPWTLTVTPVD